MWEQNTHDQNHQNTHFCPGNFKINVFLCCCFIFAFVRCCYLNLSHYTKVFIIHVYARRIWSIRMVEVWSNTLHVRFQARVFFLYSFLWIVFFLMLLTFSTVYYFRKIIALCLCVSSFPTTLLIKYASTMKMISKRSTIYSMHKLRDWEP